MDTIFGKKIESDGWQRAWKGREREITNEGTCTTEEFPNANACVRISAFWKRRDGWVDGKRMAQYWVLFFSLTDFSHCSLRKLLLVIPGKG